MNKIFLKLTFLLFLNISLFASEYKDYDLFIEAKNEFNLGQFEESLEKFKLLDRSHPYSKLVKKNYVNYYIGLNYLNLNNLDKATLFLEEAVIDETLTKYLNKDIQNENINFVKLRDFSLGVAFYKQNDLETSKKYLERVLSDRYSYETEALEIKALSYLEKIDSYYSLYKNVKFNANFKNADSLSEYDLLNIVGYFLLKEQNKELETLCKLMIKSSKIDNEVKYNFKSYLVEMLISQSKYKEAITYLDQFIQTSDFFFREEFFLMKSDCYFKLKNFTASLDSLKNIKEIYNQNLVFSKKAEIYFQMKDYKSAILNLENINQKKKNDEILLAKCHYIMNNEKKFKDLANELIQKYPNSYESIFFSYILKNKNTKFQDTSSLVFTNLIVDSYLKSLKAINIDETLGYKRTELNKLLKIAALKDRDILKLELDDSSLLNIDTTENAYLASYILAKADLYDLAFISSKFFENKFLRTKNLISLLYPIYYEDIVKLNAKNFQIDEELIYTIILNSSKFNPNYAYKNNAGLMKIASKDYSIKKLKDPELNIELACIKINKLLSKYNSNKFRTLVAYIYGEDFERSLGIENDNDLNVDSILDESKKEKIKRLLMDYTFYKKLYYF